MAYRVRAYNTALASENKIHDDAVAKRLGFRGGLVPGVDVYAYLAHPAVERWGRAWLERGRIEARFLRPVYDGESVDVLAMDEGEGFALAVRGPTGDLCATGTASLTSGRLVVPDLASYPTAPLPSEPPPASPETLVEGAVLGSFESGFHAERAGEYLADVRETLPIFAAERVAHPGYLLRNANYILVANVKLGPWIHVASEVWNFSAAVDGDRISTRGRVERVYEKKGHRFVELDLLMVANDTRPLLRVHHTAIYQPRQLS
jgi:hypothetical protein